MHVARISACESILHKLIILRSDMILHCIIDYYDHIVLIAVAGWAIIWPPHIIWPAEIGWNCCRGAKSKKSNGECHSWLC